MMMKMCLLGFALIGCAMAESDTPQPSLAVLKELDVDSVVAGRNMTITVNVFNWGKSAAFNVDLDDTQWVNIEGAGHKQSWKQIGPGEKVTVSYSVTPRKAGLLMKSAPAKVTYKADANGDALKASFSNNLYDSTSSGYVEGVKVMTEAEYEKKSSRRTKEWMTFLLLIVPPIWVPFFFYQQSSNNLKKKRDAAKALEAAEKAKAATSKKSNSPRRSSPARSH